MMKMYGIGLSGMVLVVLLATAFGFMDGLILVPSEEEGRVQPQGRLLGKHRFAIGCLAFAPDGKTLATGGSFASAPGEVKLWDLVTGRERTTLRGNHKGVYSLAFAADGRTLATASFDEVVTWWDVANGRELARVPISIPSSLQTVLAPDGRTLAMLGWPEDPGSVQLWSVDQEPKRSLAGGSGPFVFGAEGHHLALWRLTADWPITTASQTDGQALTPASELPELPAMQCWDIPLGRQRLTLRADPNYVWAVAFAPDGGTLASGGFDENVKLWDLATGRERVTLRGHTDQVGALAFSADGKLLASGSHDGTVRLWDPSAGRALATLVGHSGRVTCVAFSPDGRWIASGSHDQTVRLWRWTKVP
jgi:WD40 repeat protein